MAITSNSSSWCRFSAALIILIGAPAFAAPKLFESAQISPSGEYTFGIEGPPITSEADGCHARSDWPRAER